MLNSFCWDFIGITFYYNGALFITHLFQKSRIISNIDIKWELIKRCPNSFFHNKYTRSYTIDKSRLPYNSNV